MTRSVCRLPSADRPARTQAFRRLLSAAFIGRDRDEQTVVWTLRRTPEAECESERLAELERRCCDGVSFSLVALDERLEWHISGPADAGAILDAFYQLPEWVKTDAGAARLWDALDSGLCNGLPRAVVT